MRAVLAVFRTIVLRAAGEGYMVRLPIGTVWPTASGSCTNQDDPFEPGKTTNDHDLDLHFRTSVAAKNEFMAGADYERISSRFVQTPAVIGAYYLNTGGTEFPVVKRDDKGKEVTAVTLKAGDTLRLKGDYLKIDAFDEAQGVFLINAETGVRTRITRYTRNGYVMLDAVIPAGLTAGTYTAELTTLPGVDRYESSKCPDQLVIG